jgi:hypothetical protein
MEFFTVLKEEERCFYINYPLVEWRLVPRAVSPNQSGVTTSPLDGVTLIPIQYKYFRYLN